MPSTPRFQLPSIDYFEMVADTVPLAESRGFGRKGQRLTACGSVVGFGQVLEGKG